MITASVASTVDRAALLEQTIAAILPQVDRMNVCLNHYPRIPDFLGTLPPGSNVVLGKNEMGCGEKFRWADEIEGYHLVIDDDILYPNDYVERLVTACRSLDDNVVVGVHGVWFPNSPITDYCADRSVAHFRSAFREKRSCHLLGTGTILYHSKSCRFSYGDIYSPNATDLWFAISAQQQYLPLVCIDRDAGWLRSNPLLEEGRLKTIYSELMNDSSAAVSLANSQSWRLHECRVDFRSEGVHGY